MIYYTFKSASNIVKLKVKSWTEIVFSCIYHLLAWCCSNGVCPSFLYGPQKEIFFFKKMSHLHALYFPGVLYNMKFNVLFKDNPDLGHCFFNAWLCDVRLHVTLSVPQVTLFLPKMHSCEKSRFTTNATQNTIHVLYLNDSRMVRPTKSHRLTLPLLCLKK